MTVVEDVIREYTEFLLEELYDKVFLSNEDTESFYNIRKQMWNTYHIFTKNNIENSVIWHWSKK